MSGLGPSSAFVGDGEGGSSSTSTSSLAGLPTRLRAAVGSLRKALSASENECQRLGREGDVARRMLEQEVGELRAELEALRGHCQAYEGAIFPLLGQEGRGRELAMKLKGLVDGLRMQVEQRAVSLEEARREAVEERGRVVEEAALARQEAGRLGRLLTSLADAVKSALGDEEGEEEGGEEEREGQDMFTSQGDVSFTGHRGGGRSQWPTDPFLSLSGAHQDASEVGGQERGVGAEEVGVLKVRLRQWGARQVAAGVKVREAGAEWARRMRERDAALGQLRAELRCVDKNQKMLACGACGRSQCPCLAQCCLSAMVNTGRRRRSWSACVRGPARRTAS